MRRQERVEGPRRRKTLAQRRTNTDATVHAAPNKSVFQNPAKTRTATKGLEQTVHTTTTERTQTEVFADARNKKHDDKNEKKKRSDAETNPQW